MMRRREFLLGAGALTLASCAQRPASLQEPTSSNVLRVLNWSEYVDPEIRDRFIGGLYDLRYSDEWEDNYSGADMVGPEWDIVTPTNWLAAQLITDGQVQALPLDLIPNHVNIDPAYLTNGWDRGARFNMPWQAGITGIAYDPALTGRELRSVSDLFADDLRGRVAMIGEMREAVGLAMLANGDDPARATASSAEAGFLRLRQAGERGQFARWGFNDVVDALKAGEVAATMAWSGDLVQAQAERPDLRFVVPDDGAIRWFDTMVIPVGAANVVGAAEWMNTFYDPELAALNTRFVQYISPVIGVQNELSLLGGEAARLAENPILFPDAETRSRLFTWGGLEDVDAENDLDARFATWAGVL